MSEEKIISLKELRSLADRLFAIAERTGIDRIPVRERTYWRVFSGDGSDPASMPQPVLADVIEDLNDVRGEIRPNDSEHVTIIWHAFDHFSGLMQFIASADIDGRTSAHITEEG